MGYALTDLSTVRVVSKVHAYAPEVVGKHELYLEIGRRGNGGSDVEVRVRREGGEQRGRERPIG